MLTHILIIFSAFIISVIFVFRLVFRRDLDSAVTSLKHLQEDTMLKEGRLNEALDQAKTQKAAEIEKGKKEAKRLTAQAQKEVEKMRAEAKAKAEEEKVDILEDGKKELEKLKKDFKKDVRDEAVKLAVEMIQQVFTEKGTEHLHRQLMQEFLKELQIIDPKQFTVTTNKGTFTTSFFLTDDEVKNLKKILSEKTGFEVDLEANIDPDIITGIIIKFGDFIVDGSLRNKLNKVIAALET